MWPDQRPNGSLEATTLSLFVTRHRGRNTRRTHKKILTIFSLDLLYAAQTTDHMMKHAPNNHPCCKKKKTEKNYPSKVSDLRLRELLSDNVESHLFKLAHAHESSQSVIDALHAHLQRMMTKKQKKCNRNIDITKHDVKSNLNCVFAHTNWSL